MLRFVLLLGVLNVAASACVVRPPYTSVAVVRLDVPSSHAVWVRLREVCELRAVSVEKPSDGFLLTPAQLAVARALVPVEILVADLAVHIAHEKSTACGKYEDSRAVVGGRFRSAANADVVNGGGLLASASASPTAHGGGPPLDQTFHALFRPLVDYVARWKQLETMYEHVRMESIGHSVENRTIQALRIGATNATRQVLLMFGQHAREWASVAAGTYVAEHLALATLPPNVEVVVLPLVNPDGYEYSRVHDRLWRKNRSKTRPCNMTANDGGVDLNRNWATAWGGNESTSADPCAIVYFGEAPFSEPETQAVRDITANLSALVGMLDVHSYSELIIGPWGYTAVDPPHTDFLDRLGLRLAIAASSNNTRYMYGRGAHNGLYLASGIAADWYFQRGVLASFTVELRPGRFAPLGFELAPELIVPTAQDALRAANVLVLYAATAIVNPNPLAKAGAHSGPSTVVIVGITAGVVGGAAILLVVSLALWRRKYGSSVGSSSSDESNET